MHAGRTFHHFHFSISLLKVTEAILRKALNPIDCLKNWSALKRILIDEARIGLRTFAVKAIP